MLRVRAVRKPLFEDLQALGQRGKLSLQLCELSRGDGRGRCPARGVGGTDEAPATGGEDPAFVPQASERFLDRRRHEAVLLDELPDRRQLLAGFKCTALDLFAQDIS